MNRKLVNRYAKDNNNSAAVAIALLAGATIGAAISLLFAPQKGSDTRELLSDKAKDLAKGAKDKYQTAKSKVQSGAGDLVDAAKSKFESAKNGIS